MIRSFRMRIALWAALLAGIALAGFAGFAWLTVHEIKSRQTDSLLAATAEREATRPASPESWRDFGMEVVPHDLGAKNARHVLMLVRDEMGNEIFRSPHWPADLDAAQLSWPALPASERLRSKDQPLPPEDRPPMEDWGRPPPPEGRPPMGAEERPLPQGRPPWHRRVRPVVTLTSLHAGGADWRVALATAGRESIAIAMSTEEADDEMAAILNAFLLAMPFALALIALGAWFVSGRALKPLRNLNTTIRDVTASGLGKRIETGGEDREFEELIQAFNDMLARLDGSFQQALRFSADASHELKTPLTILQGQIERAIHQVEAGSPMQAVLTDILDEVRRLSGITRKLLLLSQADAGRLRLQPVSCDLTGILGEMIEDAKMLAPELDIQSSIPPRLRIDADESLLRQVFVNIVSNAIKYNVPGGWIGISAVCSTREVRITVSNASSGISKEAQEKMFERFYRGDAAHSRNIEGVGLGLSLSREIARAHGGDLILSTNAQHDVYLELVLPAGQ